MAYQFTSSPVTPYFSSLPFHFTHSHSPTPYTSPTPVSASIKASLLPLNLLFQKIIETVNKLKEELVEDNDESSPEDEEGLFVHESLEDVLFEEFDDGMFNSSSTCDLSNNPVSGVPVALLDNNPSPDFPLSGEKDLGLDSNTVVSAPPNFASKFERFSLATVVRLSPTTVNLVSASPPQYFDPTYDPGGPRVCKAGWNSRFEAWTH
jgi:hypothetical protein